MSEDEVEAVAAELAKAGGLAWYSGRDEGPLRVLKNRYRDRARVVIAALDRHRTAIGQMTASRDKDLSPGAGTSPTPVSDDGNAISVGGTVLYRPPGDRRAYPCRVEKIEGGRAYLMPDIKTCTGWIDIPSLPPVDPGTTSQS